MLVSLAMSFSRISAAPSVGDGKVGRRTREVVVPALQLFEVLVVDQTLLPEVLEEVEVWARGAQAFAQGVVVVANMFHPAVPRRPPVVTCILELVAQRALHRLGRFLAAKMAQAVGAPFLLVV